MAGFAQEVNEERGTATDYFVATTGDDQNSGNSCTDQAFPCRTIGRAIAAAAIVGPGSIHVAEGTYEEFDLVIGHNLSIIGSGAADTVVDAGGQGRVFSILGGASVTIGALTVTGGVASPGGGIRVRPGSTLELADAIVSGNSAPINVGGGHHQ